jgi:hypothetical protein
MSSPITIPANCAGNLIEGLGGKTVGLTLQATAVSVAILVYDFFKDWNFHHYTPPNHSGLLPGVALGLIAVPLAFKAVKYVAVTRYDNVKLASDIEKIKNIYDTIVKIVNIILSGGALFWFLIYGVSVGLPLSFTASAFVSLGSSAYMLYQNRTAGAVSVS